MGPSCLEPWALGSASKAQEPLEIPAFGTAQGSLTSGLGNSSQAGTPGGLGSSVSLATSYASLASRNQVNANTKHGHPLHQEVREGRVCRITQQEGKNVGGSFHRVYVSGVPEVGGPIRDSIAYIYFRKALFEEVMGADSGGFLVQTPSSLSQSGVRISGSL